MHQVNSFDVFDTLIARKGILPSSIFDIVAEKIGYPDFKEHRMLAEKNIINTNYNFDDIYNEFIKITGFSSAQIDEIKNIELATELDQCIPIKENLELVNDGDLLVSDMYLPEEFIRLLLKKAGLDKHFSLIVTSGGKHSGWIWPILNSHYKINTHHGDNIHSDIESPRKNSIFSNYTSSYKLSKTESDLHNHGFTHISKLIRELRLANLSIDSGFAAFQKDQLQLEFNLPILILSSIYVKFLSTKINSSNILFSSRDCYYLFKLYRSLFSRIEDSDFASYFFTSRYSRTRCSTDYIDYVKSITGTNTLVVDLCGTGRSLSVMYDKVNISPSTFLLHKLDYNAIDTYNKLYNTKQSGNIFSIAENIPLDNTLLELLNYVDHGMVLDIKAIREFGIFNPIFESPNYPYQVLNFIKNNKIIIQNFIDLLNKCDLNLLISESFNSIEEIPSLIVSLYERLNSNSSILNDIRHYHNIQDNRTMWKLKEE